MEIPGARENLTGASSTVGKLIQATGRATMQGAIQEIEGGKFKDGFINSMLANAAQEVGDLINAEIGKIPNLTESERGAMRLLSRATTSAMRMVGSNDPAAGFASDFLSGVVGDAVASQVPANQQASGASTEQGAEAIAASPDGDRVDVAMPAAGENSAGAPGLNVRGSDSHIGVTDGMDSSGASGIYAGDAADTNADGAGVIPPSLGPVGTGVYDEDGHYTYVSAEGELTVSARRPQMDEAASDHAQSEAAGNSFLQEIATRTAGAVGGTADSFSGMVQDTWRWGSNSAIQVGDLLTFGYNHDHPRVQEAWSEQEQLGRSIVNMMLNPRDAASAGFESVVNRYNAAMSLSDPSEQSRALGHLFNDVGQAAAGLGVTTAGLVKPATTVVTTIGENAFTGPAAGGRRAQIGAVGDLSNTRPTSTTGGTSSFSTSQGVESTGAASRLPRGEEIHATFPNFNAARDAARRLSSLGNDAVDFVQESGPNRGQITGRQSPDGLQGWRIDWSRDSGFHINWWDRRGGSNRRQDWLYGSNRIEGGSESTYQELFQHFPKK